MSRAWMFDTDYFTVQKGYGVYDMTQLFGAMLGNDDPMTAVMSLQQNHYDLRQSELSGPEIDAVELAYKNKLIHENVYEAIHNGPQDPDYKKAFATALQRGSEVVNQAVDVQNKLNFKRGFQAMPLPFEVNRNGQVQLNPVWKQGATAQKAQLQVPGNKKVVNPFYNGQLVTHIASSIYTAGGNVEGWARPYEEALQAEGFASKKRNDRVIRGHKDFSNRNLISINDHDQLVPMFNELKRHYSEATTSGLGHQEAMDHASEQWMADKRSFSMTGHHNHAPESSYGRNVRDDSADDLPVPDEVIDQEEAMNNGVAPGAGTQAPQTDPMAVIHPDHREANWFKNMNNNIRHSLYDELSDKPNVNVMNYLKENHHMDDESAKEFVRNVRMSKGGRTRKRFVDQLLDHHIRTTQDVPQWFDSEKPPSVAEQLTTSGSMLTDPASVIPEQEVKPREIATVPPPPPRIEAEPPPMPIQSMGPPANTVAHPSSTRELIMPPNMRDFMRQRGNGINSNIPLSNAPNQSEGGGGVMSQIADLLGRLSGGGQILRSEDANQLESYLENVQLEIAKATLEDLNPVPSFDINSPTDIAMMGAHIQRPTADVISILFTKGDWRNIAHTIGVEHEKVQMVKVAFS